MRTRLKIKVRKFDVCYIPQVKLTFFGGWKNIIQVSGENNICFMEAHLMEDGFVTESEATDVIKQYKRYRFIHKDQPTKIRYKYL